ncbi:MAG: hypothetical protein FWB91_00310 [Defluviitaleaceae bacterium]|nr:hypothetical protein [Defluviitaleaceae bacterium]
MKEIVSVKFQSKNNKQEFSGREYSYFAEIDLQVGDIVSAPVKNGYSIGKVTKANVSPQSVGCSLSLLKTIHSLAELDPEPSGDRQQTITDAAGATPAPAF